MTQEEWVLLSPEEKKQELYRRQKELLDRFLERRAITLEQYNKGLSEMNKKMGVQH